MEVFWITIIIITVLVAVFSIIAFKIGNKKLKQLQRYWCLLWERPWMLKLVCLKIIC